MKREFGGTLAQLNENVPGMVNHFFHTMGHWAVRISKLEFSIVKFGDIC